MPLVAIPDKYSIQAEGVEILRDDRILLSLRWGGGLFKDAYAEAQIYDPNSVFPVSSYGGIWDIYVGGQHIFRGYVSEPVKERGMGGQVFTIGFRGTMESWDVLLTNQTFGPNGADHTVTSVVDYIRYLVETVSAMSGIPFQGPLPQNNKQFTDIYQDGILAVTNSTYLSEIRRACQALGFIIFNDPVGTIRIIDATNPPGTVIFTSAAHSDKLLTGIFREVLSHIPATVLVNDDVLNEGAAYGHLGTPQNNQNYNETKIDNITFATTVGMKKEALPEIAEHIYTVSRKASKKLHIEWAGIPTAEQILGYQMSWTDSAGAQGQYTISGYEVDITPSEMKTVMEGYIS